MNIGAAFANSDNVAQSSSKKRRDPVDSDNENGLESDDSMDEGGMELDDSDSSVEKSKSNGSRNIGRKKNASRQKKKRKRGNFGYDAGWGSSARQKLYFGYNLHNQQRHFAPSFF